MKKYRTLIFIALAVLALTMCNSKTDLGTGNLYPTSVPTSSNVGGELASLNSITANGVLLPARSLALGFGEGGQIEVLEVQVGDVVYEGQLIARLNDGQAQLALGAAEAALAVAQADYDLALSNLGAQRRAASLDLSEAQSDLDALYKNAGITRAAALQEIVEASQALETVQYRLYYFVLPTSFVDLDPLQALALAQEGLDGARAAFEPYKNATNSQLRQALMEELDRAKSEYSAVARWLELEAELANAQARLEKAILDYEDCQDGPDSEALAMAEARLTNAQAELKRLDAGGDTPQIVLAQAQVGVALQNLETAQAQFDALALNAPIDGVISAIGFRAGEWVEPGAPVIELLDLSGWLMETKNVGELQIGQIQIGQAVHVRMNAFQDHILKGRVTAISPEAIVQQGDITYTLIIALDQTDLNLRPGMTARVEILLDHE